MYRNKLLIATPETFGDPHFNRSVILLVDSTTSGHMGFILNKPLDYKLNDVLEGVQQKFPLYYGGPVEPDNLFYLHKLGNSLKGSIPITDDLFWGGDFDALKQGLKDNTIGTSSVRFFLGYSGWAGGQLDEEMTSKTWVMTDNLPTTKLFKEQPKALWRNAMVGLGGAYLLWANAPNNPKHN